MPKSAPVYGTDMAQDTNSLVLLLLLLLSLIPIVYKPINRLSLYLEASPHF